MSEFSEGIPGVKPIILDINEKDSVSVLGIFHLKGTK